MDRLLRNVPPPAPCTLIPSGPARALAARGVVPSSSKGRIYELVRSVRVEVYERVREDGTRLDWLVCVEPCGANRAAWPEYTERASGDDPEVLIRLLIPDGVFVPGVYVAADEIEDLLDDIESLESENA